MDITKITGYTLSEAAKKGYSELYHRFHALGLDKADTPERKVREGIIDQAADEKYQPLVGAVEETIRAYDQYRKDHPKSHAESYHISILRQALRKVQEAQNDHATH